MAIHILGIRHHGVGSAKNLRAQLADIKPDIILVEGPPEISDVLTAVGKKELVPPVAIMVYNSEEPRESVFYPFAEFSPEWVAIQYANSNQIPVKTIDLPAAVSFTKRRLKQENVEEGKPVDKPAIDPLGLLARTLGYQSGEEWWEYHFEQQKSNSAEHFEGVMHVMDALRAEGLESSLDEENVDREAYMRSLIRQAQNSMYTNIAVVCGAWHAPSLNDLEAKAKQDLKILKAMPKSKIKVTATWIPWTNSRLSMFSGYGAGIYSPGWYAHQWKTKSNIEIAWLTKVAGTLRAKQMDISTAHVIEAFNLSRSLASLRDKYYVSLEELNEATLSVMCMGDQILLELVKKELIVGDKLGKVPDDLPKVPLQEDFEQKIKSLKLRLTAEPKQYDLDLRKEIDLKRSIFLYRLEIIGLSWARRTHSRTKGTFKESWMLEWSPDMMIELIDKSFLGNTIELASKIIVLTKSEQSKNISEVSSLIQLSIPSELFDCIDVLLDKIVELSTISSDIVDLMTAIPNLVDVSRYGNVRKSDLGILNNIVQQLFVKVFVGLANACYGLDEDNSIKMFELVSSFNNAVHLYNDLDYSKQWNETLHRLIDKASVHPIILGCVCRLLLDSGELSDKEADDRISFALSANNEPQHVAGWLEGFLKGNGMILVYDNHLWNLLYSWVSLLPDQVFMELLPLLRRTFSKFEYGERRQIGNKAKQGKISAKQNQKVDDNLNFDRERALSILPVLKKLIGIDDES
jgi:hypothetical protein